MERRFCNHFPLFFVVPFLQVWELLLLQIKIKKKINPSLLCVTPLKYFILNMGAWHKTILNMVWRLVHWYWAVSPSKHYISHTPQLPLKWGFLFICILTTLFDWRGCGEIHLTHTPAYKNFTAALVFHHPAHRQTFSNRQCLKYQSS